MKGWRRRAAALLAALMLTGCSAAELAEPLTPRGGYIETDVTPPFGDGYPLGIFTGENGSLDYFVSLPSGIPKHMHSPDGGEHWEEKETPWFSKALSLCGKEAKDTLFIVGMDGETVYCALWDREGLLRMFRTDQPDGLEDVTIPEWRSGALEGSHGIDTLYIGSDGSIGVNYSRSDGPAILYRPDAGESVPAWLTGWDMKIAAAFTKRAIALLTETGELRLFDTSTGELSAALLPPHRTESMALASDSDDALYVASEGAVDRLPAGGNRFERVLEGKQYAFGKPGSYILRLCYNTGSDTFYILAQTNRGDHRIYRYAYDPALPLEK